MSTHCAHETGEKDSCTEKESPPEKKLKVEENDELKHEEKDGDQTRGSDLKNENETKKDDIDADEVLARIELRTSKRKPGFVSYDWRTWPNKDDFIAYFRQFRESEGFEFDVYPGATLWTPIYPMRGFKNVPEFENEIRGYAKQAIEKYFGNDGIDRPIIEIERVNGGCATCFFSHYITFTIDNQGQKQPFQAKVNHMIGGKKEIEIIRPKPNLC